MGLQVLVIEDDPLPVQTFLSFALVWQSYRRCDRRVSFLSASHAA
jgi:hypothetical protein